MRRSRKRVRDVITTDLPSLLAKEFSPDQENNSQIMKTSAHGFSRCAIADMHRARWIPLFEQMDKALSEEEEQLVSARKETLNSFHSLFIARISLQNVLVINFRKVGRTK